MTLFFLGIFFSLLMCVHTLWMRPVWMRVNRAIAITCTKTPNKLQLRLRKNVETNASTYPLNS